MKNLESNILSQTRLEIKLHFTKPHKDIVKGLREVFLKFVESLQVCWIGGYRINAGHDALYAPYDEKLKKRILNRLTEDKANEDEWFVLRDTPDELQLPQYQLNYNYGSSNEIWLTLWLPIEQASNIDLILSYIRPLPYASGYAGIGFVGNCSSINEYVKMERKIANEYPAIHLPNEPSKLGDKIHDVSWLTFISSPILNYCNVNKPEELELPECSEIIYLSDNRYVIRATENPDILVSLIKPLRKIALSLWPAWFMQTYSFSTYLGEYGDESNNHRWQLRWILPEPPYQNYNPK